MIAFLEFYVGCNGQRGHQTSGEQESRSEKFSFHENLQRGGNRVAEVIQVCLTTVKRFGWWATLASACYQRWLEYLGCGGRDASRLPYYDVNMDVYPDSCPSYLESRKNVKIVIRYAGFPDIEVAINLSFPFSRNTVRHHFSKIDGRQQ